MSIEERLTHFLKESANWEKKSTSISDIFLLKLPRLKTSAGQESIAIEINPINSLTGFTYKEKRDSNKVCFRTRRDKPDSCKSETCRASKKDR